MFCSYIISPIFFHIRVKLVFGRLWTISAIIATESTPTTSSFLLCTFFGLNLLNALTQVLWQIVCINDDDLLLFVIGSSTLVLVPFRVSIPHHFNIGLNPKGYPITCHSVLLDVMKALLIYTDAYYGINPVHL